MPAKDILPLFRAHKLHSGRNGKIVRNPAQARAIEISYARKEGADIPEPKEPRMVTAFKKARR